MVRHGYLHTTPRNTANARLTANITIDDKALLETERGKVREFRKLDALVSLVKELGVDRFSVSLRPCE